MQGFAIEQAYRKHFAAGLIDLSSSSPISPRLSDIADEADRDRLLDLQLGYEPGGGSRELREAVASLYSDLGPENVLITAGALEAIRVACMTLVSRGQRVLVQEPAYAAIRQGVIDAGGRSVVRRAEGPSDFDLAELDSINLPDLAFLNSPHGPTGAIARGIASFRGRLVVDEVYRPIDLAGGGVSPSCIDYSEASVAIGDLSKPLGLGGLRVGWIAARDASVIEHCADALDYLSGSISCLSAPVATLALRQFEHLIQPSLQIARRNLSRLAAFVERHRDLLDWTPPQAGFTACVRLRAGPPPLDLFEALRAQGVFLLDGAAFGLPDCLRIGLGLPETSFRRALDLLGNELRPLGIRAANDDRAESVILYTKLPLAGESKSRLATGVGTSAAAALAEAFLRDSIELAGAESRRLFVALGSQEGAAEFGSAFPNASVFGQRGAGMGERLKNALQQVFARGAKRPVLLGSDSPTLPGHLLGVASRALATHDVVLGPAEDGGYYAIGMNACHPELFESIDWSTHRVFEQTVNRAHDAGLRVFILPRWYDIDTAGDLDRLREDVRPGSATGKALKSLGL